MNMLFWLLPVAVGCAAVGALAGDIRYSVAALCIIGPIVCALTKIEGYLKDVTGRNTILVASQVVAAVRKAEIVAGVRKRG
jgi:hypothetical protein